MTKPTENELFEKWAIDYGLDWEPNFTRLDVETAWQARAELADKEKAELQAAQQQSAGEIAELKAKVSELDGMLGKRNLHKEHEYLQRMNELKADNERLQAQINELREALEDISNWAFGWDGDCGVTAVALQALAKTPAQCLIEHDNEE